MKLQIDTVAKTIKLEQSVKIVDFISLVKKLLPNDWKEYSIEAVQTIFNWYNPIYVPQPIIPMWEQPWTTVSGVINVDTSQMSDTVCDLGLLN